MGWLDSIGRGNDLVMTFAGEIRQASWFLNQSSDSSSEEAALFNDGKHIFFCNRLQMDSRQNWALHLKSYARSTYFYSQHHRRSSAKVPSVTISYFLISLIESTWRPLTSFSSLQEEPIMLANCCQVVVTCLLSEFESSMNASADRLAIWELSWPIAADWCNSRSNADTAPRLD